MKQVGTRAAMYLKLLQVEEFIVDGVQVKEPSVPLLI